MGNDSGVKAKHKQRTPPHNKHSAFPGMGIPSNVNIVGGSIKAIQQPPKIKILPAQSNKG